MAQADAEKPKRPMSAFFLFLADKNDSTKAENPTYTRKDITKHLSVQWGTMTADEKKPYQDQYEVAKKEYQQKVIEWEAVHGTMKPTPRKSTKTKAKSAQSTQDQSDRPPPPKKSQSAYFLFSAKHRNTVKEENPSLKPPEVMKELGVRWKALSEDEKKVFNEEAAELKKVYDEEKKEYEAKYGKIVTSRKKGKKAEKEYPDEAVGGNEVVVPLNGPSRKRVMLRSVLPQKKTKIV